MERPCADLPPIHLTEKRGKKVFIKTPAVPAGVDENGDPTAAVAESVAEATDDQKTAHECEMKAQATLTHSLQKLPQFREEVKRKGNAYQQWQYMKTKINMKGGDLMIQKKEEQFVNTKPINFDDAEKYFTAVKLRNNELAHLRPANKRDNFNLRLKYYSDIEKAESGETNAWANFLDNYETGVMENLTLEEFEQRYAVYWDAHGNPGGEKDLDNKALVADSIL